MSKSIDPMTWLQREVLKAKIATYEVKLQALLPICNDFLIYPSLMRPRELYVDPVFGMDVVGDRWLFICFRPESVNDVELVVSWVLQQCSYPLRRHTKRVRQDKWGNHRISIPNGPEHRFPTAMWPASELTSLHLICKLLESKKPTFTQLARAIRQASK